jgi:hypothetical protein
MKISISVTCLVPTKNVRRIQVAWGCPTGARVERRSGGRKLVASQLCQRRRILVLPITLEHLTAIALLHIGVAWFFLNLTLGVHSDTESLRPPLSAGVHSTLCHLHSSILALLVTSLSSDIFQCTQSTITLERNSARESVLDLYCTIFLSVHLQQSLPLYIHGANNALSTVGTTLLLGFRNRLQDSELVGFAVAGYPFVSCVCADNNCPWMRLTTVRA